MPARSQWSVDEPRTLALDEPVSTVSVRIAGGTVNIVGTESPGPARVEISELHGPPLTVTHSNGRLTVAYDDLHWKGFLKLFDRKGENRSAVVSLTVPATARVEVGVVGASAVVSGISGRTEVRGVSGDSALVGLTGPVHAETVSGRVEAQAVTGGLHFRSVSGDLTLIEGSGRSVRAGTVSGDIVLDLAATDRDSDIALNTVSGEIAIRLAQPADAKVDVNTAGGDISCAFEDLRVTGQWGAKSITGKLGTGSGRLKASTVSGAIALLRRPPSGDRPEDEAHGPYDSPPGSPDAPAAPARPADKKVL